MIATRTCFATLAVLTLLSASLPAEDKDDGFKPLFNGKNLDGWVRTNTPESTWSFKDGLLICTGKPIGELRTEKMYQNFIMEIEWRHMKPRGNAGIFIWADDITARGVPFHRGIEVQVLENAYGNSRGHTTHGDIFPIHGAKMTPVNGRGGSRAFPTESRSNPSPEWNHYRIECQDGDITLAVNGKVVTRGKDCTPSKGYICLESEGGIVHYRNAKIKVLPDSPVDEKDVAIANRGYRSIYSGLDLSGWKNSKANDGHWKANDWVLSYDGKTFASDKALVSTESFGDFGFLMDFRLKKDSGIPIVQLRGESGFPLVLAGVQYSAKPAIKPGQWARVEGTVIGNRISVSIDGKVSDLKFNGRLPATGPIRIVPDGAIDFANIYVRKIK
jgi:hypothetical protein